MSSISVPAPTALTAAQCRAGRALIEWSQAQLSQSAAIDIQTIADFEKRVRSADETTRRRRGAPQVQPRGSLGSEPLGR